MKRFIRRPDVEMVGGIIVDKDTRLEFKNEHVEQTVENLVLHSVMHTEGEGYESTCDTIIYLKEGDVLVFEEEHRGYIKPVEAFMTIAEAISELENIKDLDDIEV